MEISEKSAGIKERNSNASLTIAIPASSANSAVGALGRPTKPCHLNPDLHTCENQVQLAQLH